jgi:DnaJ like chaperone protein
MKMLELIGSLFTFGFNIIGFFFALGFAVIAAVVAIAKRRNPWIWGLLTLIRPWFILFLFFLPTKIPRVNSYLKNVEGFGDTNIVAASIMALSAVVAKADGQVTKEEVTVIRQYLVRVIGISPHDVNRYEKAFNYGKEHPEEYKEFAKILRTRYSQRDLLAISYLLISIGIQGNEMSEVEDRTIQKIVYELGLSEFEYINIRNHFMRMASGQGNAYGAGGFGTGQRYGRQQGYTAGGIGGQTMSRESLIEKYTKILQVPKDSDLTTIKKAYRKLAKEYHPDKVIAEGMPEDYVKYATEQSAKINEAYDYLKEALA